MSGGSEMEPASAPMKKIETEEQSYTPISMIADMNLSPSIHTEALTASKICLPDTPVIQTIYVAPYVDNDSDEIVYASDGEVGQSYDQVKDEGGLNPPEEDLVDMRIETKTTAQVDANNAPPEMT